MDSKRWSILYRGPLSSCNYGCTYCPFAKTRNTRAELRDDAEKLARFSTWVSAQTDRSIGLLFTPWGEALIRKHYQRAMIDLSRMPHVERVAAQTNLSCKLDWIAECDLDTVAFWTTFHPTQTSMDDFLARCDTLDKIGARYSVGVVGFKEAYDAILELRERLSPSTYLWINAYKREPDYYTEEDVRRFEAIDPLFRYNTRYHKSQGKSCQGGTTAFTVDGDGVMRTCHFIDAPIGNIYADDFREALAPKTCATDACGCHIGYIHLDELALYDTFERGLMERIPAGALWHDDAAREGAIRQARRKLGEHIPAHRPSWA